MKMKLKNKSKISTETPIKKYELSLHDDKINVWRQ